MRILRNKKLLILSITAIALLTLTLGVSYAYFTATVTGNDSAVVTKIVAGILDVDFTITDRISNDNILLIKDEKREEKAETLDFTVSNNGRGTLDAVYYVYLTDLNITNNLKSPDFKWELIKNDDTVFTGNFSSAETNTDFTITSETNNGIVIPVKQELSVGQVDRYKLRIWLSETEEDQNSLLNGSFSGKVRVTSTQLTGSEKYVVFKDQSGTQLGKKIISDGKTNYTMDISSVNLTGSTNIYCNNGGIPTITSNTLNIGGVSDNVECKISNDIEDTIANQLTTSKTGIVMTNNQDDVPRMIINNSKEVVLDLNGKEINSIGVNDDSEGTYVENYELFRIINSTFTVNDSVGTGGAYTGTTSRVFYAQTNSNVIINNGNFNGRQSLVGYGSNINVVINGGHFRSNLYAVLGGNECVTNCIYTINGGEFIGKMNAITNNISTFNIYNGYFSSVDSHTIYNPNENGTINLYGGVVISSYTQTITNSGNLNIIQTTSPIYIKNENTNAWAPTLKNNGVLNIVANNANKCTSNYLETTSGLCIFAVNPEKYNVKEGNTSFRNDGTAYVDGGSFYGGYQAINNDNDGNLYIKNAEINSLYYGIWAGSASHDNTTTYICSSSIVASYYDFALNNGKLYYTNNVIFNNGTNIPYTGSSNTRYEQINACPSWPSN